MVNIKNLIGKEFREGQTFAERVAVDHSNERIGASTARDVLSSSISGRIAETQKRIGELSGAFSARDVLSSSISGTIAETQKRIGELSGASSARDVLSRSLSGTIAETQKRMGELCGASTARDALSRSVYGTSVARDALSTSLYGSLAAARKQIDELYGATAARNALSGSLSGSLAATYKHVDELTGTSVRYARELVSSRIADSVAEAQKRIDEVVGGTSRSLFEPFNIADRFGDSIHLQRSFIGRQYAVRPRYQPERAVENQAQERLNLVGALIEKKERELEFGNALEIYLITEGRSFLVSGFEAFSVSDDYHLEVEVLDGNNFLKLFVRYDGFTLSTREIRLEDSADETIH